ncbi:MAG: fibronectin type III domain-containing protein [Longimicrobiales bacterium]
MLGNPHYHQATDRLNTIDQRLVAEVARTTAATLMLLASSPSRLQELRVEEGSARWSPAPETGVTGYEVRWETASGWSTAETAAPSIALPGLRPGGAVEVRALRDNGTRGWDWARTGGATPPGAR